MVGWFKCMSSSSCPLFDMEITKACTDGLYVHTWFVRLHKVVLRSSMEVVVPHPLGLLAVRHGPLQEPVDVLVLAPLPRYAPAPSCLLQVHATPHQVSRRYCVRHHPRGLRNRRRVLRHRLDAAAAAAAAAACARHPFPCRGGCREPVATTTTVANSRRPRRLGLILPPAWRQLSQQGTLLIASLYH